MLNRIRNRYQNQKYISVRIIWFHRGKSVSHNLGVRIFEPTVDERDRSAASDLIATWTKRVLAEFAITDRDLAFCTSDSGSDVKRALETRFDLPREWCISHLCHLALSEAFGTSLDPNKSKNKEAREIISKIRSTFETVNKSPALKCIFDEKVTEEFERTFKLKNAPAHRWSAIEGVTKRLLFLFLQINSAFIQHQLEFPLETEEDVVVEYHSIIRMIRAVQNTAQKTKSFVGVAVFLQMVHVFKTTLDPQRPLQLFRPR